MASIEDFVPDPSSDVPDLPKDRLTLKELIQILELILNREYDSKAFGPSTVSLFEKIQQASDDMTRLEILQEAIENDPSLVGKLESSKNWKPKTDPDYKGIMKQNLADLIDLLAGNPTVITTFSNHLYSASVIPVPVHGTVSNSNQSPHDRATQLFKSVNTTIKISANPRDILITVIKSLYSVGFTEIASELEDSIGEQVLQQTPSTSPLLESIDYQNLEEAFKSGMVKARISKAVVQGPARSGKTSVKCLLTGQQYTDQESTSVLEAPLIAIDKYSGNADEVFWTLMQSDDEMLTEAIKLYEANNQVSNDSVAINLALSQPTLNTSQPTISMSQFGTISTSLQDSLDEQYLTHNQATAISQNTSMPEQIAREIMKKARSERKEMSTSVLDTRPADKPIHKDFLYFVDSGGQIQFQQLLHAFLPCVSLLLLVTNIAEDLCTQSSTDMQHDGVSFSVSDYSLSNKEILERIILMVDSSSDKLRKTIKNDPSLQKRIKIPKLLHIMAVATHLDDLQEKCLSKERSIDKEIIIKQKSFHQILSSFDGFICPNPRRQEAFYIVSGLKALQVPGPTTRGEAIQKISSALKNQSIEVEIPLRWYAFELLLRKTAESYNGVLTLSICKMIGEQNFSMSPDDVESSLKFFHILNTILYYHDQATEDDSKLVFVHPDYLFKIIKDLTVVVCKLQEGEYIGDYPQSIIREAHRAFFPTDFLSVSPTCKEILKHIPDFDSNFFSIFEHLMITTRKDDDLFFVPALLPLIKPSEVVKSDTCPYIYLFPKLSPMGKFCQLIIHLLSHPHKWGLSSQNELYSNCITLRWDSECDVQFIEYHNHYKIYCSSESHRFAIREELDRAIKFLITFEKQKPSHAVICPCDNQQFHDLHFAELREYSFSTAQVVCLKDNKKVKIDSNTLCWISNSTSRQLSPSTTDYDGDIAYDVLKGNIELIKQSEISLDDLITKMLEKGIVNETDRKNILDIKRGLSTVERYNELLSTFRATVKTNGDYFGWFIRVLRDYNTELSNRTADKLMADYTTKLSH